MVKRIDVPRILQEWKESGEDVTLPIDDSERSKVAYPWASMISLNDHELCSLSAAYSILSSYNDELVPTNLEVALPSQGGTNYQLGAILQEGIDAEKEIAKALLWKYGNSIEWNKKVDRVGKADFVTDNEILEIKCTVKDVPSDKWIAQICLYMDSLSIVNGQIILVSRKGRGISSFSVIRKDNIFLVTGRDFRRRISHEEILLSVANLQSKIDKFPDEQTPPFEAPFKIEDGIVTANPCLYMKESRAAWSVQCNGTTVSGDRCKNQAYESYLCKYHINQDIDIEYDGDGTWINGEYQVISGLSAKINCAWFGKCWGVSGSKIEILQEGDYRYFLDDNGLKKIVK